MARRQVSFRKGPVRTTCLHAKGRPVRGLLRSSPTQTPFAGRHVEAGHTCALAGGARRAEASEAEPVREEGLEGWV